MNHSNDPLIQAMIQQTSRNFVRELDAYSKKKRRTLTIDVPVEEEIIDAENKIGYLETVVDYIKGVIKSVDNRGWDIKNAIEWKKFEAGASY